ncbi:hypothetical protein AB0K48_45150, partial [Nonomuraea sp. NPDC055795]
MSSSIAVCGPGPSSKVSATHFVFAQSTVPAWLLVASGLCVGVTFGVVSGVGGAAARAASRARRPAAD